MKNNEECKYRYLKIAFGEIKPTFKIKSSIIEFIVAIVVGILLGTWISFNDNTINSFKESCELINGIMLAFVAMEMGAYAIFQALLSSELVRTLYEYNENMLKNSNRSFLGIILLFWLCIMLNAFLLIILIATRSDWTLTKNAIVNSAICTVFTSIYYAFNFRVMFEVRNYAINLYKVFETHNIVMLIKGLDEKKEPKDHS